MPKEEKTCKACNGTGRAWAANDYPGACLHCNGTGSVSVEVVKPTTFSAEKIAAGLRGGGKLIRATELLKKIEAGNPGETSLETCNVLHYESGDVSKHLVYAKIYPEKSKYHKIEAKIAMSDLLVQCNVICDREGWDFKETHEMGIARLKERIDRRMKLRE